MFAWRDNYISYNGASANDPYWTSVSLLQNYEYPVSGATDLSTNNFQAMISGTARPSARSPFTSGGGSYKFDTSTASIMQFPPNAVFNPGSSNFTIECWAYFNTMTSYNEVFCISAQSSSQGVARLVAVSNGTMYFLVNNPSATNWIYGPGSASGTVTSGVWYHLAGVRNGTTFTLYVNGVVKLTYTTTAGAVVGYAGTTTTIGNMPPGTSFTGASDNFVTNARWVNGTAVYTSAFTPPTSPLTAITNTGLLVTFATTGTNNNSTFTDVSIYSNIVAAGGSPQYSGLSPFTNTYPGSIRLVSASSQYLSYPTNGAIFTYAAGNFTIECWFYLNSTGAIQYLIDQRNNGVATAVIPTLYIDASNFLVYYVNGAVRIQGTNALTTGTWYSVSVARSASSTKMFLNGTQEGSTYSDSNSYVTSRVVIGSAANSLGSYLNGYITNVRLSKGFAYYTANYTPSIVPLTVDSTTPTYTSLLLLTAGFNDVSTIGQSITTPAFSGSLTSNVAASASISKTIYKFGTQSAYYSSTSGGPGYQTVLDATSLQFGTGDFTIEGWVYRSVAGVLQTIISKGSSTTGWILTINGSNQLVWTSTTTNLKTSTTTIGATTWTYFAITRSGTTGYMFINGTLEGATYSDTTNYNQTNNMLIGADRSTANGLNGYLDDIRVTKGVCRYTASFTAPTSAFPTS